MMDQRDTDTAIFTAFMLAGATGAASHHFERYSGQIGFAHELVPHARAIAEALHKALDRNADAQFPGVLEYELVEPLGRWIVESAEYIEPRATAARFLRSYRDWIRS